MISTHSGLLSICEAILCGPNGAGSLVLAITYEELSPRNCISCLISAIQLVELM